MTGPQPTGGNGWREGRDPVQRLLRILTVLVCLGTFIYLIVDPLRSVDDWPTIALALGAALVLLGYEGVVRLPFLGKPDNLPRPEPPQPTYAPPAYTPLPPGADPDNEWDAP
jgi:hypothetical protein